MTKHFPLIAGLALLAVAIVAGLLVPMGSSAPATIPLPVTRMLACAVGDPTVGQTTVSVTDQSSFSAGELGALPNPPDVTASFDNPAKTIIVRGSSSVAGVSQYNESGTAMAIPCAPPVTTGAWNAVMTTAGATLVLTNVDATPAVVDVFLYGQTGPITSPGLRDIPVASGATQMLPIDASLAQSDTPIGVQVRASKGRIAAVLRILSPGGFDWQLPQTSADTDVVIAGIPADAGIRTLSLTNTDPSTKAEVQLQILGQAGAFQVPGLETIEVLASRVTTVDITQALGGQASAIHLISDHPVTASISSSAPDPMGASGQAPLAGTIVLPPVGGVIWAANPTDTASWIQIKYVDASGAPATLDTPIPAQSIASADLPTSGTQVVVSTDSAEVRASLVLSDGGTSILPLVSGGSATSVPVPSLAPGLG